MPHHSIDPDTARQIEKTRRVQAICSTITTSLLILSCAAVAISGQWADFAKTTRPEKP